MPVNFEVKVKGGATSAEAEKKERERIAERDRRLKERSGYTDLTIFIY